MSTDMLKGTLDIFQKFSDQTFDAKHNEKLKAFLATEYTDAELERFSRNLLDSIVHHAAAGDGLVIALDLSLKDAFGDEDSALRDARREKLHQAWEF